MLIKDYFEDEFDFVGFFVGIEFDEGLEQTGHGGGARLDEVLEAQFLFGFGSPAYSLFALVAVEVLEMEDVGALELELANALHVKLAAVETLGTRSKRAGLYKKNRHSLASVDFFSYLCGLIWFF